MNEGWETKTLGDVLAVLRNGVNCKQDKSGDGDKISRIESIADASFDVDRVGYAHLSEREKERFRLRRGDILFSHINSPVHVGKTAVFNSEEPVYHGVNLLVMRPNESVTSAYLERALKYLFETGYWRGVCKQSVNQASVNQQDISRVEIRFPKSLHEQQRIVGILDEAFAGIATAKGNAEKNLRNARHLFESHLEGVFARGGWISKPLEEICEFENGDRGENYPSKSVQTTVGVPFINAGHLGTDGIDLDEMSYIPRERFNLLGAGKIRRGDILFCLRGSLGKAAIVNNLDEGAIASSLVIIRPTAHLRTDFLLAYLQSSLCAREIDRYRNGAAQPNLSARSLSQFRVPVASLHEQAQLMEVLGRLRGESLRLASLYQQKLTALDELKKSLLHQAFTGQLTGNRSAEPALAEVAG